MANAWWNEVGLLRKNENDHLKLLE